LRILLIEDNPADVMLVEEVLRQHEIVAELQVISDGEVAFAYWNELSNSFPGACPDLVVLDLNLPHRSGLEILERIRTAPRCADVNVIIASSSSNPVDLKRARALGIQEYFRKPSHLKEFMHLGVVIKDVNQRGRQVNA